MCFGLACECVRFVEPVPVSVDADRAKAPWGRGEDGTPLLPMGAHWTDVPELVDQRVAEVQARVDEAQSGHWYDASATETWRAPGTVCTRVDGYHRTVGQLTNVLPGDLELILHAHADLSWCLEMIAKFRARVAGLEAERHSTNEALDDAVQALRADATMVCHVCEAPVRWVQAKLSNQGWWNHVSPAADGHGVMPKPAASASAREVLDDAVREPREVFAERARRETDSGRRAAYRMLAQDVADGEHYASVHHDYREGRDLPETGGAR